MISIVEALLDVGTEVGQYFWVAPLAYCWRIIHIVCCGIGERFWRLEKIVNDKSFMQRARTILGNI
jgi:hypothetical protein